MLARGFLGIERGFGGSSSSLVSDSLDDTASFLRLQRSKAGCFFAVAAPSLLSSEEPLDDIGRLLRLRLSFAGGFFAIATGLGDSSSLLSSELFDNGADFSLATGFFGIAAARGDSSSSLSSESLDDTAGLLFARGCFAIERRRADSSSSLVSKSLDETTDFLFARCFFGITGSGGDSFSSLTSESLDDKDGLLFARGFFAIGRGLGFSSLLSPESLELDDEVRFLRMRFSFARDFVAVATVLGDSSSRLSSESLEGIADFLPLQVSTRLPAIATGRLDPAARPAAWMLPRQTQRLGKGGLRALDPSSSVDSSESLEEESSIEHNFVLFEDGRGLDLGAEDEMTLKTAVEVLEENESESSEPPESSEATATEEDTCTTVLAFLGLSDLESHESEDELEVAFGAEDGRAFDFGAVDDIALASALEVPEEGLSEASESQEYSE